MLANKKYYIFLKLRTESGLVGLVWCTEPGVDEDGVSGYVNPGILFSPKARLD